MCHKLAFIIIVVEVTLQSRQRLSCPLFIDHFVLRFNLLIASCNSRVEYTLNSLQNWSTILSRPNKWETTESLSSLVYFTHEIQFEVTSWIALRETVPETSPFSGMTVCLLLLCNPWRVFDHYVWNKIIDLNFHVIPRSLLIKGL